MQTHNTGFASLALWSLWGCLSSNEAAVVSPSSEVTTAAGEARSGNEGECCRSAREGGAASDCGESLSTAIEDPSFYPDSVVADSAGNLYIGSATTGQIIRVAPGGAPSVSFPPTGHGTLGIALDEKNGHLWRCRTDLASAVPSVLDVLDLRSGWLLAEHPLSDDAFCNGVAVDSDLNAYATDSRGQRIFRVAVEDSTESGSPAAVWATNAQFAAGPEEAGVDGIVFHAGALYVSHFAQGNIYRVTIRENGTAGPPELIDTAGALSLPDGISPLGDSLLVTEFGAGELSRVQPSGESPTVTRLRGDLKAPTSVAVFNDRYWVVESQLDHLFDPKASPPQLPFKVTGFLGCASSEGR